jgi:hypothetical protein
MRTRRLLAATMLAALPLLAGALQSGPHLSEADAAGTTYAAGRPSGPRALWWAGVDGETAMLSGLMFAWNPGLGLGVAL